MTVVQGVERDLAELRVGSGAVAGFAATALRLAEILDDPGVAAQAKASCARALAVCLDRIRELVPAVDTSDRVDDLTARRVARRAAS